MRLCVHCNQEAVNAIYGAQDALAGPFCCQGCLTVYTVINLKGLSEYYEIKKNVSLFKKRSPVELGHNQYSYLDDKDFLIEYTYINFSQQRTMEFYLEGIHCLACLWIIEKLPEFVPGVVASKLNLGRSVVTVSINEDGKFSDAARELDGIGYRPHALRINQQTSDFKIKEERSMLLRIGIAGAASGNIMLYAISLYAGAGIEFQSAFNLLTVVFALPVLLYSAYPFYRNSYVALKNRTLSIDVPISLALIMGGIMGVYNLVTGVPENYFDSLTALVFLLLLSRYFLKNIQEKGLTTNDLNFFYQSEILLKQDENSPGHFLETHPKSLKVNDVLKVLPNQMIPADGIVIQGETYINNSLLSGESKLKKVNNSDEVYSGTMNVSNEIMIRVLKLSADSRLGNILRQVENGWGQKSKIVDITQRISKYFVAAVFILAALLFIYQAKTGDIKHATEIALTLLIVTCPCALAIATPLTFIRTLAKCAQKGIIIKDDQVIEKLSVAQNVFIDKTGTLTQNALQITSMKIHSTPRIPLEEIFFNLEMNSQHPVGKCLKAEAAKANPQILPVFDFLETPGVGVSGIINGNFYEIKNYGVYENENMISSFVIKDSLRPEAFSAVKELKKTGKKLLILSGDRTEYVSELAEELQLSKNEFSAEMSPESKAQAIKKSTNTVMIGDGANDSIALSAADTGIAVFGAMDISLRAADVYLTQPGLKAVNDLFIISTETMRVVRRNLVLSIFYNSASVFLAFAGLISPLTAAIIMPLSSLTVLISTLIGTKKLREQWK